MVEPKLPAEGWYRDPYRVHEKRWFSQGRPTSLVGDGEVESHDPLPAAAGSEAVEPEELAEQAPSNDLRRADEAQADAADERNPAEAAWESMPAAGQVD